MSKKGELNKKIMRTLLAMSLVYAGGMFCGDRAEAFGSGDTALVTVTTEKSLPINDNKIITSAEILADKTGIAGGLLVIFGEIDDASISILNTVDFNGRIDVDAVNTSKDAVIVSAKGMKSGGKCTLNMKNDIIAKADAGHYALLLTAVNSAQTITLNVNPDDNKTVQLLGNVGVEDGNGAPQQNLLELHLTNEDSYLAGDLKLGGGSYFQQIRFTLTNGAVWYPVTDTYENDETVHSDYSDNFEMSLKLDGGIIDLYHSQPGVARANAGTARTFTLNGITSNVSDNSGTTFRIGSDVMGINNGGTGIADKVVLNADASYSGNDKYFIQIVADPSISSSVPVLDVADKKIVVAKVDGSNMTNSNTTIEGSKYKDMDLDAGLTLADVTPELEYDDSEGGWIIKKVTAENFRSTGTAGEKGSALTLAEIGATTMLNAASAWRAENNDLLRRMGDLRNGNDEAGAWVRMYGGKNEVVQGQQSDLSYKAVQGGYDYQNNLKNGRLFTGFTVSHLDGDVSGNHTDGDINSTLFGVYGSYVGDKGHFADLIVKYGRINSDFTTIKGSDRYGSDYGSNGFSITTEYGYRQNLKNNFYIEPQAELTYSRIGGSDYTMSLNDKDGAKVSNDAFNSLIGRVGFTVGRQQEQSNIYAKLSLAREFKGEVATRASYGAVTRSYESGGSDTWLEYGIGFNAKMSKGTNLYGEIEKTTGSVIRTKWRANLGVRYSF